MDFQTIPIQICSSERVRKDEGLEETKAHFIIECLQQSLSYVIIMLISGEEREVCESQ